ncbi:hypothetical protein BX616_000973 [Lobosporangium transversale]|uniref:MULE transposase domain-containing protein n=1 Tax=Lobosporangium transversale TaxID=64571 RepID=A0A1Y2GRG2_9FUNG|nr:hypothetical protein BCR41DRAFT_421174 [Lobosporangium transversale]KAF9905597.1 hypothetical protein BX616_000973 [Lobosporangium transversale]ORZ20072.1 hypothetical protein BCR41DRAFT_421174 [Lobosporangium transversale]|eukprot:XP_021882612.1 hypothetical protein BCR41DRAFT_421174 [Lobosporangium transversale]
MTQLTLKDILHYAVDYDPLVVVEPYPIPREADSPHPFTASFTIEQFRSFWNQERIAFQWQYCSERNSRTFYSNQPLDTPLPCFKPTTYGSQDPGRPREYDWSVKHGCRQRRREKALTIGRSSVGKNCPAHIRIQKVVGQDRVNIEYHWRHNHSTAPEATSLLPLGPNEHNWSKKRIMEDRDWKDIKVLLRPSSELVDREGDKVSPAHFIKYNNIRASVYRRRVASSQKHKDVKVSVNLWIEQIHQDGGKGFFVDHFDNKPDQYLIAWSFASQLKIIQEDSQVLFMDSTCKAIKSLEPTNENLKVYTSACLFTIFAKDAHGQRGIPIAHMISSSKSRDLIIKWLSWLKIDCGLNASKFIVDRAVLETEIANAIFPDATIYYSLFHLQQLWEEQLKKAFNSKELDKLRPLLTSICNATSEEQLLILSQQLKVQHPGATAVFEYIENNWFNDLQKPYWMIFMGDNYQHVDTKGLVEGWRSVLKRYRLDRERSLRADCAIYMLQKAFSTEFNVEGSGSPGESQPIQIP